ncbi:EspA/EspE family type VII secretion system effector [Mycolicibacterium neoaurum]|uniref:TPR repeat region-containing protein n=1 Tax=Mycolicibacterium neoaurum TaxID=1795 RepID=UPI001F4CEE91|nr:EspA/EspE family type VII secretion system effector [Mycolicibacterium neoaurum]
MGALEGFLSTWDKARQTFGAGVPQTGEQFDQSAQLQQLQSTVQTAAPGSAWSGTAANAYGEVNKEHARVLGELAVLDRRLANHVNESANVVATGRQNLDNLRQWVVDAAASVPPGKNREQLILPIVQKGLGELSGIVSTSNSELNRVAGDITKLGTEWDALQDQKFGGAGKEDKPEQRDDEVQLVNDEEPLAEDGNAGAAEEDVRKTLSGEDPAAAQRVHDVLNGIVPGQELTAEQDAYLTEMQLQQSDMSIEELQTVQERLGADNGTLGDSWQLMSNDDVAFGPADDVGGQSKGSFDRLPDSVQRSLSHNNLIGYPDAEVERQRVGAIADIVRSGDQKFQSGTELDRAMIRLSDRLMDEGPANNETVRDLFTSAGRDHQVVTDHLVGHQPYLDSAPGTVPYDYNSDDFMMDIAKADWSDDGRDAATLFSWTNEASADPATSDIASAAAERYAQFLGNNKDALLDIPNSYLQTDTLGQVNPALVQGMAHGLTPYMADIASVSGGEVDNFEPLEADQTRPLAKGIFAVLGTDVDAYREFNTAANELAIQKSYEWATDVKNGADVSAYDARMNGAATLKGLIDHGTAEGLRTIGLDTNEMTDLKKSVYNQAVSALSAAGGPYGPAISLFGSSIEDSFFGNGSDISGQVKPMFSDESARFAANALIAAGVTPPGYEDYMVADTDLNGQPIQRLGTVEELRSNSIPLTADEYAARLNDWLQATVGPGKSPADAFGEQYDDVVSS